MKEILTKHKAEVSELIFKEFDEAEFLRQQQKRIDEETKQLKEELELAKEETKQAQSEIQRLRQIIKEHGLSE